MLNYLHVYFLSHIIITSIFTIGPRCDAMVAAAAPASSGCIFSFGCDAITASEIETLCHSYIFLFAHSLRCLTVLGISVCLPWNVIIISVLEIVCDQNEFPHRIYPEHSQRVWLDVPCIRHIPSTATTNSTFIYGKSPLNATQNEFNNESNIKMVICYVRVRAKGMAVCECVSVCLSLDQFRWFSFCSFISSELVASLN